MKGLELDLLDGDEAANIGIAFGESELKAVIGMGYVVNGSDCVYDGNSGYGLDADVMDIICGLSKYLEPPSL